MKYFVKMMYVAAIVSLSFGCARTVTTLDTVLYFDITINFRENVDLSRMRYFVLVSPLAAPRLPSPFTGDYFPAPGHTFDPSNSFLLAKPNGLATYYTDYFSSYSDYFELTRNLSGAPQLKLYSSGTTSFSFTGNNLSYQPTTGFVPVTVEVSGSRVHIVYSMSFLPLFTNQIFFNVAVTEVSDGTESGAIRDVLDQSSIFLALRPGDRIDLRTDDTNFAISGSSDITSWEAQIR